MSQPCPRCDRANIGDRFVCLTCTAEAARDLQEASSFLDAMDDKRARRGSSTIDRGSPNAETPLPYDPRVSRVLTPARNTLTTWARLIIEEHGCRDLPAPKDARLVARLTIELDTWEHISTLEMPHHLARTVRSFRATLTEDIAEAQQSADLRNLAEVALWIGEHHEWVTGRPWAHDLCNAAQNLREQLAELFDNPPDMMALGVCGEDDCTHLIAAPIASTQATCPHCGHVHDVQQRRLDLLKQADDLTVTVKEAVRLLQIASHTIDARTMHAVIRHFGIASLWRRVIPGSDKPVSAYPLGALREAVEMSEADDETRRAVQRIKRGNTPEKVPA